MGDGEGEITSDAGQADAASDEVEDLEPEATEDSEVRGGGMTLLSPPTDPPEFRGR